MSIFQNNSTQIITSDILLNEGDYIGENVTLIFQGGMIKINPNLQLLPPSLTITGQHTKIIAPITQIFGDSINVDGTWDIDRAYPQWFGAKPEDKEGYETTVTWNAATDCSEAINKAITMKQVGEVFIPCGYYKIRKPILIPIGIQLNGEKGMVGMSNSLRTINHHNDGTILVADRFLNQFPNNPTSNFMVYVNAKVTNGNLERLTDEEFLSGQITGISNICFKCKTWDRDNGMIPLLNSGGIGTNDGISPQVFNPLENPFEPIYTVYIDYSYNLGCIYAVTTMKIDNVRFENFIQAVLFNQDGSVGETYFDAKHITNCDYSCNIEDYNVNPDDRKYAFDLGFLGDAMLFEHNGIHNGRYNKGVRATCCGGGRIANNIINADVMIDCCKALDFSNNHMEGGKTLTIRCSNVATSSNFFEMGVEPSVVIKGEPQYNDKCIVTMNNDTFVFYDYPRDYDENNEEINNSEIELSIDELIGNRLNGAGDNYLEYRTKIITELREEVRKSISTANYLALINNRFDIIIDNESLLNISNQHRQWMGEGLFGKIYPTGISVGMLTYTIGTINGGEVQITEAIAPFEAFNKFSYRLSLQSRMSFNHSIDYGFSVKGLNLPSVYDAQKSRNTNWYIETGGYNYYYQVIYDYNRKLAASNSLIPISISSGNNGLVLLSKYGELSFTQSAPNSEPENILLEKNSVLLLISSTEGNDNSFILRLFRKGTLSNGSYCYHYVDIPVCGTNALHDNGIAINGFVWREIATSNVDLDNLVPGPFDGYVIQGISNVHSVDYRGDNIMCRLEGTNQGNSSSQWKKGDILVNMGTTPSIEIINEDEQ